MLSGLLLTYKYLRYSAPSPVPVSAPPPGLHRHFITTPSDGPVELLYTTPQCSSTATPVYFVHGGMGSAWVWTEYMSYLAERGVPSYAVSMRGHGSSWHPSYFRMCFMTRRSALASDVLAGLRYVEERHGGARVLLVGHSSGGGLVQGILSDGQAKVAGLTLLDAVPCFGSLGVYRNWAKVDPWFSFRMILHGWHPNSPLSHPTLVRRIFFSDDYPDKDLETFSAHGSIYEAMLWPFSMMYNFANPRKIFASITGGPIGGDNVMVMTGTADRIMTPDIMLRLGEVYRSAQKDLVLSKKADQDSGEVEPLAGAGGKDIAGSGVRVTWIPGAGHHAQNDVMWRVGAEKLHDFYGQL